MRLLLRHDTHTHPQPMVAVYRDEGCLWTEAPPRNCPLLPRRVRLDALFGNGAPERVRVGFGGAQPEALQLAPLCGTHLADVHKRPSYVPFHEGSDLASRAWTRLDGVWKRRFHRAEGGKGYRGCACFEVSPLGWKGMRDGYAEVDPAGPGARQRRIARVPTCPGPGTPVALRAGERPPPRPAGSPAPPGLRAGDEQRPSRRRGSGKVRSDRAGTRRRHHPR